MLRRSQTRIDPLVTMSKIPQARPLGARMRSDVFADVCFWRSGLSDRWSARLRSLSYAGHASPFGHPVAAPRVARRAKRGGARRDRTDDLMLAKHALSQLSYGPVPEDECFYCARGALAFAGARAQQPSLKRACRAEAAAQRRLVGLGRLELPTSRLSSARSNQLSYKPLTTRGVSSRATGLRRMHRTSASPWRVFVREERETKTAKSRQWSSTILIVGP